MTLDLTTRNFTIEGNVITITSETRIERYRVPKGRDRISVEWGRGGRAILTVGTLRSMTMRVVGPSPDIAQLLEAVT